MEHRLPSIQKPLAGSFRRFAQTTATAAPASANPSAMPRPISAITTPVTTATRPVRSNNAVTLHQALPFKDQRTGVMLRNNPSQIVRVNPPSGVSLVPRDVASLGRSTERL